MCKAGASLKFHDDRHGLAGWSLWNFLHTLNFDTGAGSAVFVENALQFPQDHRFVITIGKAGEEEADLIAVEYMELPASHGRRIHDCGNRHFGYGHGTAFSARQGNRSVASSLDALDQ